MRDSGHFFFSTQMTTMWESLPWLILPNTIYYLKQNFTADSYQILISDWVTCYIQSVDAERLPLEIKKHLPHLATPAVKLLPHVSKLLIDPQAVHTVAVNGESLTLTSKGTLGGKIPLVWTFECLQFNQIEAFTLMNRIITKPLLAILHQHDVKQQKLLDFIKKQQQQLEMMDSLISLHGLTKITAPIDENIPTEWESNWDIPSSMIPSLFEPMKLAADFYAQKQKLEEKVLVEDVVIPTMSEQDYLERRNKREKLQEEAKMKTMQKTNMKRRAFR